MPRAVFVKANSCFSLPSPPNSSRRRKKPETRFNFPKSNNPTLIIKVTNLSKITDEIILRYHFDQTINPEKVRERMRQRGDMAGSPPSLTPRQSQKEPFKAGNFVRCHICQDNNNNCNGTAFLEYLDEKQVRGKRIGP